MPATVMELAPVEGGNSIRVGRQETFVIDL
jgi:hypothetical protein